MNDNERDTHFVSFAKLVWDELENLKCSDFFADLSVDDWIRAERRIIAQRAYDLAVHIVAIPLIGIEIGPSDISDIPDLTEWPTPPTEPSSEQ